jgi:hypothetical protein
MSLAFVTISLLSLISQPRLHGTSSACIIFWTKLSLVTCIQVICHQDGAASWAASAACCFHVLLVGFGAVVAAFLPFGIWNVPPSVAASASMPTQQQVCISR